MTPAEHAAQVRMVNASMLLADERKDRHNVTRLSQYRPCQRCTSAAASTPAPAATGRRQRDDPLRGSSAAR
jgi:hypothetical protein